jgi:PAS domain-containing protein
MSARLESPPHVTKSLRRSVGAAAAIAEGLLEQREPRVARRLSPRERRTEIVSAGLFVLTAAVLPLVLPSTEFDDRLSALLLVLCYALMRRVRFPLGPGLLRPTQLVFVPMVFLTPAPWVPALVGIGHLLGELPDIMSQKAHAERLLMVVGDAWYAVGPALVIALAGSGTGGQTAWGVLVLALAAQFATDLAASSLREWFGARLTPGEFLPVMALVYLVDAMLAPIGYLAVLASDAHQYAYLLAIAPGAVLGLLARERSGRIAHELALERAFRRSTRALDARAQDLRRQAGRLQEPGRAMGEAVPTAQDRAALEVLLLTTVVEAVQADCGRLSALMDDALAPRVVIGRAEALSGALDAAEASLGIERSPALALAVGPEHVLALARERAPFSPVERELVEHLAAQAAVALENLRLGELMRRTEAELRAILEGVADAVVAEDPAGRTVYRNAAATELLDGLPDLAARLQVPPGLLPGRRVLAGEEAEPLVVQDPAGLRWSRVKASPVLDDDAGPRLAISVVEDITEIKQAEEAQRFLAESSRVLASSLDLAETLPEVERLAAGWIGGGCDIDVDELPALGPPSPDTLSVPIRVRGGVAGTITLSGRPFGPLETAVAEDLGLRVGAAVDSARLYRTRAAIAQTLQASLLPPVPPEIPGLETAALYRPAGAGNEVGGDFYDVFSTGEGEWFLVMGDVCGKGAEAAAVTALARYTIRAAAMRHRSPAEVLRWLNAAMLGQRTRRFVTIACARLDLLDGAVGATVACGGHPFPRVLRTTGDVEALGTDGTLLGVLDGVALEDRMTALGPGDALILYTDGLTEAAAPYVWTPEQLDGVVAGGFGRDAEGIVEHLAASVEGPLRDDLALLAVRVQPLL